jgi:hypothetical protein
MCPAFVSISVIRHTDTKMTVTKEEVYTLTSQEQETMACHTKGHVEDQGPKKMWPEPSLWCPWEKTGEAE